MAGAVNAAFLPTPQRGLTLNLKRHDLRAAGTNPD